MIPKVKLLDQVRAVVRAGHLSHRAEDTYHNFIKRFILFHNKRHPKEMSAEEVRANRAAITLPIRRFKKQ